MRIRPLLKENSPLILTAAAAIGTIGTAYLAGKASIEAVDLIRAEESAGGTASDRKTRLKERTKLVWKCYIPTAACAGTTIACIVGANRVEAKKTMAAQAAFAVSQRAYSEYRDRVIEEIGEKKERKIIDSVREKQVHANPPPAIIAGSGSVMCCELETGRYFMSDRESLHKAVNVVNAKMNRHDYATLDDFYYELGIRGTSRSGHLGWKVEKLLELDFTTTLSESGIPCLAFDYNYIEVL